MNLPLLAAEIADRVPEMARECPTNRAAVIEGMIRDEIQRANKNKTEEKELKWNT